MRNQENKSDTWCIWWRRAGSRNRPTPLAVGSSGGAARPGWARSAHGLRKLGAQRCAEAGASEHQLMALFGWANPKQAALYTKKANRAKLEAAAAPLLEARSSNAPGADSNATAERDSNESVPLFAGVPASGTVRPKKL